MRRTLIFLLGSLMVLPGWAQETVIHDPNAVVRAVKGYHGIEVSNGINLFLSQGEEETVAVSATDPPWRDRIETEVKDGILRIRLTGKGGKMGNYKLRAYVSFTILDYINASGSSDVYVDGVMGGDKLSIGLSGSSDFKGAVRVRELRVDQSGASDSEITGRVQGMATFQMSGSSNLKGYDLAVEDGTIDASGSSMIRITLHKEMEVNLSGSSAIYYKGEGVIRKMNTSGSSRVVKEDGGAGKN